MTWAVLYFRKYSKPCLLASGLKHMVLTFTFRKLVENFFVINLCNFKTWEKQFHFTILVVINICQIKAFNNGKVSVANSKKNLAIFFINASFYQKRHYNVTIDFLWITVTHCPISSTLSKGNLHFLRIFFAGVFFVFWVDFSWIALNKVYYYNFSLFLYFSVAIRV